MERLRNVFYLVGCKCCFIEETNIDDQLDQQKCSQIDVSSIQLPKIPFSPVAKDPSLTLTVVESEKMQIGKIFSIGPNGLRGSDRSPADSQVFAGSGYLKDERIINDLILPNEKGIGERHFVIQFRKSPHSGYFIKDLGDGMGTFIRLSKPLNLKTNFIISFGDSHMIVFPSTSKLSLRFIYGPKLDQQFKFFPKDSPVRIGRNSDCQIQFNDTSFSRYHCTITYNEHWLIQDGDGNQLSTNGTWLYAEDFFPVHHQMLFKVGETLFRADLKT